MDIAMKEKPEEEKKAVSSFMDLLANLMNDIKGNPDKPQVQEDAKKKIEELKKDLPDSVKDLVSKVA